MYNISIKTRSSSDGQFVATCPELAVSCQGQTEEEALNKLQSLVYFHVLSRDGFGEFDTELRQVIRRGDGKPAVKVLYLPDKLRVH